MVAVRPWKLVMGTWPDGQCHLAPLVPEPAAMIIFRKRMNMRFHQDFRG
jgi:hypothetical protein